MVDNARRAAAAEVAMRRLLDGIFGRSAPRPTPEPEPEPLDEATESRLAICRACEHFATLPQRCRRCGCLLSLKVRLASSHCPIGKW